jgi:Cu/Ag efflux protein CusF
MRMYIIPAVAAATLAFTPLAMAAAQHANGTIKAYDAKALTLTLTDGSVYMLPKTFKDPGLKTGEKVSIAWEMQGKHKTAETVTIAK